MKKTFIIGITGGSGSGKTSFIRKIRDHFGEKQVCVLSQDEYYRDRTELQLDKAGKVNFDKPKTIHKKEFYDDIIKLKKGKVVQRKEYTFNNDLAKAKMLRFQPAPILIIEGLYVFHYKKIRNLLDLKIFLHAKDNLKVIRRIKRDGVERNYPIDDVLYRYQNHVLPSFEKYIEPYMEQADIIINNNDNFDMGLQVIEGFLQSKLL